MARLENKKEILLMMTMCTVVYFVSYITRINYSAVMVDMIARGDVAKQVAALAVTVNSIVYGAGQLISGYLGDKVRPYKLTFCGLLVTAAINVLMPFNTSPVMNVLLWSVNGLAQAFMWPPLVRIMSTYLNEVDYKKTCGLVSSGSGGATLVMYLCSPLLIRHFGWKASFFIPSAIAVLFAVIWFMFFAKMGNKVSWEMPPVAKKQGNDGGSAFTGGAVFLLALVMLGIVFQGILRDGITNWMPTYIKETFDVGSDIAILSGVVLPIFHILCNNLALTVNRKWLKNELLCTGVFFIAGGLSLMVLAITNAGGGIFLSIAMFALAAGSMHGINVIFTCLVPRYFAKFGKVSLMSGLLNSCTYVGAAIATYGSSVLSQKLGWNFTVIMWTVTAACGILVCFVGIKGWEKFRKEK